MMTRKHFEAVAEIIKHNSVDLSHDPTDHERGRDLQSFLIMSDLADYFATENANFDRARFIKACSLK